MDMEAAKAYFDKLQNDENFVLQVHEALIAARNKVVVEAGLAPFSEEELEEASGELSETQLGQITGGLYRPRPSYSKGIA